MKDSKNKDSIFESEVVLESKFKSLHQGLYDEGQIGTVLSINEELYLICGLIIANLPIKNKPLLEAKDFKGKKSKNDNDSKQVLNRVRDFLEARNYSCDKIEIVINLIEPILRNELVWKADEGDSFIKTLFFKVRDNIIPYIKDDLNLDLTGLLLNTLNNWTEVEQDEKNDVVLTPRYVGDLMVRMARINKDSYVWDRTMGTSGLLISAMDAMIADSKENTDNPDNLKDKINSIKDNQLLGTELLNNIYILAMLNNILLGGDGSNLVYGDAHTEGWVDKEGKDFPATALLLNPPYSEEGKGLIFAEEAMKKMEKGYACVLIQENAGAGKGDGYSKDILKRNTLIASIHMPSDLFKGKASVQTAIYVFKIARPHKETDKVKFIDFSNDGYKRQNRKKSTKKTNLRNVDNAIERYTEVGAIVLGEEPKTSYYTIDNELLIEDTISLNGDDWTYSQHKKIDLTPTEEDFMETVSNYLSWKVSDILKEGVK